MHLWFWKYSAGARHARNTENTGNCSLAVSTHWVYESLDAQHRIRVHRDRQQRVNLAGHTAHTTNGGWVALKRLRFIVEMKNSSFIIYWRTADKKRRKDHIRTHTHTTDTSFSLSLAETTWSVGGVVWGLWCWRWCEKKEWNISESF